MGFGIYLQFYHTNTSDTDAMNRLAAAQAQAAEQLRADLPKKIDDLTTLTDVSAEKAALIYRYEFDTNRMPWPKEKAAKGLSTFIAGRVCSSQDMKDTMAAGGVYVFRYVGADGESLYDMTIGRGDCTKLLGETPGRVLQGFGGPK